MKKIHQRTASRVVLLFCVWAVGLLLLPTIFVLSSEAASSVKGRVTEAEPVFYAYLTPEELTQVNLTLMWKQNHADLVLIQICNDTLQYNSVAASKRTIRLDTGIPGDIVCVLGIFTFGKRGDFTLSISGAVSGPNLVKSRADLSLDPIYDERGEDYSFPRLRDMAEELRPKAAGAPELVPELAWWDKCWEAIPCPDATPVMPGGWMISCSVLHTKEVPCTEAKP